MNWFKNKRKEWMNERISEVKDQVLNPTVMERTAIPHLASDLGQTKGRMLPTTRLLHAGSAHRSPPAHWPFPLDTLGFTSDSSRIISLTPLPPPGWGRGGVGGRSIWASIPWVLAPSPHSPQDLTRKALPPTSHLHHSPTNPQNSGCNLTYEEWDCPLPHSGPQLH